MLTPIWLSPFTDRAGRVSLLKSATFLALLAPAAATLWLLYLGDMRAEPAKAVNHALGLWAFRLLLLSLAVTPAMQIFRWPRLILVRRMIGVAAFAYAVAHLLAYAAMENFDLAKVVAEIFSRFYLTVGLAALLILTALAATSFDNAIRRLGAKAWQRLHRFTYLAAVLALVHYVIQSKLIVFEPTVFAGLLLWLMLYRLVCWTARPMVAGRLGTLILLAIVASVVTMGGEAASYWLLTPLPAGKVLAANVTFSAGLRPGWYVAMFGLGVVLLVWLRRSAMLTRGAAKR